MTNKDIIIEKYREMKKLGIKEAILDEEHFGSLLMVFINQEPKDLLYSIKVDGDTVYLGSDSKE